MAKVKNLSELEGVAIGIIQKQQPCTAYSIRMKLQKSPSSHWRGSAGSIYPLLDRLEGEGLVTSQQDTQGKRGRKLLSTTEKGKMALVTWIKNLQQDDLIADVFDPVRSRIFYLDAMSDKQQLEFAKQTLAALEGHLNQAEAYLAQRPIANDLSEHLGALGGFVNAQSRVALIKEVLKLLGKQP